MDVTHLLLPGYITIALPIDSDDVATLEDLELEITPIAKPVSSKL
jgi:hypothetical protein